MEFIVLTYDDRISFVELLILSYLKNINGLDINFRVAYNNDEILPKLRSLPGKVTPIKCATPIKSTMRSLLEGISDDEFVYWCGDDRYVDRFRNVPDFLKIYKYLSRHAKTPLDAVRILTNKHYDLKTNMLVDDVFVFKNKGWVVHGFWNHQFIRRRYLNKIFVENSLSEDYTLRDLHIYLEEREHNDENMHRIYDVRRSLFVLGETTYHNLLTINCAEAFVKFGLGIPDIPKSEVSIWFDKGPVIERN